MESSKYITEKIKGSEFVIGVKAIDSGESSLTSFHSVGTSKEKFFRLCVVVPLDQLSKTIAASLELEEEID